MLKLDHNEFQPLNTEEIKWFLDQPTDYLKKNSISINNPNPNFAFTILISSDNSRGLVVPAKFVSVAEEVNGKPTYLLSVMHDPIREYYFHDIDWGKLSFS